MTTDESQCDRVLAAVKPQRLLDAARKLIAVPSRTGEATAVLDCLADMLSTEGLAVERPDGGYPQAPAVAVRWSAKKPGKTLQFNGHLDTVHLPFVPPSVDGDLLHGSGSADMKAGVAAAVEALLALRDADALDTGAVLLTAHDLHETPWGDGRQLNALIGAGYAGDAVLLPEYLSEVLPVIGRGGFTWKVDIQRPGPPIHEVLRPAEPNVIAAGADWCAVCWCSTRSWPATAIRWPGRKACSSGKFTVARSSTSIHKRASSKARAAGCRARAMPMPMRNSAASSKTRPARPAPR